MSKAVRDARRVLADEFIMALDKYVDPECIIARLCERAEEGDMAAINVILDRCVGAVSKTVNVKGMVGHVQIDAATMDELCKRFGIIELTTEQERISDSSDPETVS